MNVGEAKRKTLMLIREYSNNGRKIAQQKNADYLLSMNHFFDIAQKEIAAVAKIPAVHSITRNPIPNLLGLMKGFDIKQHLADDVIFEADGAKSYYFEVDRTCEVHIERLTNGAWESIAAVEVPSVSSFTAYKGHTGEVGRVRIRFSGAYPYNIRNVALYGYQFPTDAQIPDYVPYVAYEVPDDFMELQKVIQTTDVRQYKTDPPYYWEGRRKILINYYEKGQFDIHYFRYPHEIPFDEDNPEAYDGMEFDLPVEAQELIPYLAGSLVMADENTSMADSLKNDYMVKMNNLSKNSVYDIDKIQNVYGLI